MPLWSWVSPLSAHFRGLPLDPAESPVPAPLPSRGCSLLEREVPGTQCPFSLPGETVEMRRWWTLAIEWKWSPVQPCPTPPATPALPSQFLHHTPTSDAKGKRAPSPEVGMAVSMDTISIVTIWGEGGGGRWERGGLKGRDKKYIYKSIFSLERLCLNERCAIPFDSILKLSSERTPNLFQ